MGNQIIWLSIKHEPPTVSGWYLVRYKSEKRLAMYFKTEKRSYGDSQWFVDSNTGYSWQGLLPNQWADVKGSFDN